AASGSADVAAPAITAATVVAARRAAAVAATIAAIKAATAPLIGVAASAVVPTALLVVVAPATVATVSAAAVKAVSVAVKPGAGADEDTAYEIIRSVEAIGCAGVRIIIVVAVCADWRWAVVGRDADSDAEGDALGLRVRSGEETNRETNGE